MSAREDLAAAWAAGDPDAFADAYERRRQELTQQPWSGQQCPEHHLSPGLSLTGERRCLVAGCVWRPRPPEFTVKFLAPNIEPAPPRQRTRRWVR